MFSSLFSIQLENEDQRTVERYGGNRHSERNTREGDSNREPEHQLGNVRTRLDVVSDLVRRNVAARSGSNNFPTSRRLDQNRDSVREGTRRRGEETARMNPMKNERRGDTTHVSAVSDIVRTKPPFFILKLILRLKFAINNCVSAET